MTPEDEDGLIERAKVGDIEAYASLVREHQAPIRSYLTRYLRDAEAADDLAQDVFVAAFRDIKNFARHGQLGGWLFGIARHRANMHLRSEARRLRRAARHPFWSWLDETIDDPEPYDTAREMEALRLCLKSLPGPQGRLVREHYFAATPLTDIARKSGKREVTVRVELFRARLWLRACISKRLKNASFDTTPETAV
jgi:RNA polymerase sigma-70 factor (ECF subfamily)